MHWADDIAEQIVSSRKYKPYWVDDMKTPSGYAHIGSILGPIIHSCIYRALRDKGEDAKLTFVINDFDTADEFPSEFKEQLKEHAGKVLKMIPSPIPGYNNLADLLANDFKQTLNQLGFEATYLSSWDMYHEGKFDDVIRVALDNSEKIQEIYEKVSGSKKKEQGWLPFQVICEKCGKLGTTKVTGWDGENVSYRCEKNLVTWAEGCGNEGKVSPFGGNGKLPWKVDWPAHWKVMGVTVEGAGKDHASAGGSYDIAMAICKEIFNYPDPFRLPYEFLLIGGKKMSSSKGLGLKAHDLTKILPPEVARFLFVRKDITEQTNFDPSGSDAIPNLFDEYDKSWMEYDRTFILSQIKNIPPKGNIFLPRFREVANYLQQPNVDVKKKFEEIKGEPLNETELNILEERIKYAKVWIESYAPKEAVYELSNEIPDVAKKLSTSQKKFLSEAIQLLEQENDPEKLQTMLYNASKEFGTKDSFSAIYLALIGKNSGPKAAWFLLSYPKEKILERLEEVINV